MKNYNSTLNFLTQVFLAVLLITTFTAGSYTVKTVPNVRLKQGDLYVSDPDNLLSAAAKEKINKQLFDLEERLTVEVAVVVLESIGQAEPRTFANELFKEWGIGKKEDDNGLLILLLTGDGERAVVFETGYGIEGVLPDILCFRIQQNEMLPYFKENDYNTGMIKGVEAVIYQLETGEYDPQYTGENQEKDVSAALGIFFIILLIAGGTGGIIYGVYKYKRRGKDCPKCKIKEFRYTSGKNIIQPTYLYAGVKETVHRCHHCGYVHIEKKTLARMIAVRGQNSVRVSYPNKSSGGGGGGSSSAGGRSFGGGRSGGGGAISRF